MQLQVSVVGTAGTGPPQFSLVCPGVPRCSMENVSGGQGMDGPAGLVICSTRALPAAPLCHQPALLAGPNLGPMPRPLSSCISLPADRTEPWDGMWPCLSGLLKLRGRLYFVVWIGKWHGHGHPQLQRSCFALVEGK